VILLDIMGCNNLCMEGRIFEKGYTNYNFCATCNSWVDKIHAIKCPCCNKRVRVGAKNKKRARNGQ
jgi:DNA-directed RNA polymerase subunit RPC12/RpoP